MSLVKKVNDLIIINDSDNGWNCTAIRCFTEDYATIKRGNLVGVSYYTSSSSNPYYCNIRDFDHCVAQIGVVYDIPTSRYDTCYVGLFGKMQVLLQDSTSASIGDYIYYTGPTGVLGRGVATGSLTPDQRLRHYAWAIESVSSGTDVLVKCIKR